MFKNTNEILNLFSKFLQNPSMMLAMRAQMMSKHFAERDSRKGAQGLLVELWKKDGLTNAEIAELLDIRPSSVTAQVKQLEEEGLVERVRDENDKRVSRVVLTEKGKAAEQNRNDFHDDLLENLFGALSEEEQETLKALLTKLNASQSDDFDFRAYFKQMPGFDAHHFQRGMWDFREAWGKRGEHHNPWNFGHGGRGPGAERDDRDEKGWEEF